MTAPRYSSYSESNTIACSGAFGIARRRRHALEHGLEHGFAIEAGLGAAAEDFVGIDRQRVLDFFFDFVDAGVHEIDLVDHRHDRQVVLHRRVGVGDGLGLDALERIDQQHRPFAAASERETS